LKQMTKRKYIAVFGFCLTILFLQFINSYSLAVEPEYISIEELKKLIDSKADIVIIDVRPTDSYDTGHIPKAISVPFPNGIHEKHDKIPKNKLLVLY